MMGRVELGKPYVPVLMPGPTEFMPVAFGTLNGGGGASSGRSPCGLPLMRLMMAMGSIRLEETWKFRANAANFFGDGLR